MLLFLTSYVAGLLTVLAPCVLPLLPIIIGNSAGSTSKRPVLILIGSLAISIVLFTLLLRASTLLISVPQSFWTNVSGGILIFFGIITLFPDLWKKVSGSWSNSSNAALNKAAQKQGWQREALMGFALGPVFTSCSPTYSLILAMVLPASFIKGVFYTIVYALGLATVLFAIALLGQRLTKRLRGIADPNSTFKRVLGLIFLIVGLAIIFGWDKAAETWIIDQGYFGVTSFEEGLVDQLKESE